MSLTPSNHIALGTPAPSFNLLDTISGSIKTLNELKGHQGTLILFICNHCPFVVHINPTIVALAKVYQSKGINFIAISSNNIETHPQDAPALMTKVAKQEDYTFPYLYDETQEVAKAYRATCTPDIFLFDEKLALYYHGQIDDSRPGNDIPCDGQDLRKAFNNLLSAKETPNQKPSIGCNIKWK